VILGFPVALILAWAFDQKSAFTFRDKDIEVTEQPIQTEIIPILKTQ
jgi:hypothetical protein